MAEDPALSAAERVAELVAGTDARFTLGLAGGSTPAAMYRILRHAQVDWSRVDFWLSDERWVPWDDDRSNGHMATTELVSHVGGSLHRPRWATDISPEDSAVEYEERLVAEVFGDGKPDLILLGVGEDGHTASLFPGSPALDERNRWFVSNTIPESGEHRLTAAYPLLWSAHHLLVLALGANKAAAVADSFVGTTPAGRLREGEAVVEWHLDRDAASQLS